MLDRRNFLLQSSLAGTGLLLGGKLNAFGKNANEKIIIGAVGTTIYILSSKTNM